MLTNPVVALSCEVLACGQMDVTLRADGADLSGCTLCFSMLAPIYIVRGGALSQADAGYCALPVDSMHRATRRSHGFSLRYCDQLCTPKNISWLPQGSYLRRADGQLLDVLLESAQFFNDPGAEVPAPVPLDETAQPRLQLLPTPVTWRPQSGSLNALNGFDLDASMSCPALIHAQALFARLQLPSLCCRQYSAVGANPPALTIIEDAEDLPEDGYRLEISPARVALSARAGLGAFYGLVSLGHLIFNYRGQVPCGALYDHPRFSWRGQHLDCARHYFQPESIEQLLDLMAFFKLNKFHWHACDDEAFRFEVECYPKLWTQTRLRGEGQLLPGYFGGGRGPSGGSYSRAQVQHIVARAKTLGIEVMPEIEIPAHASALVRVFAELIDPQECGQTHSVQGYENNAVNPAMPFTWTLLRALIEELARWFGPCTMHLGCDELPDHTWSKSPAIDDLMRREQLESTLDVQAWMMRKLALLVTEQGCLPAAWDEASRGKAADKNLLLFTWRDRQDAMTIAAQGHDVVMCPAAHTYFDLTYWPKTQERGLSWAAPYLSLAEALQWQPIAAEDKAVSARIRGVQGQLWSETIHDDADMGPYLVPRILGLAEVAWTFDEKKSTLTQMYAMVAHYERLLTQIGWPGREQY